MASFIRSKSSMVRTTNSRRPRLLKYSGFTFTIRELLKSIRLGPMTHMFDVDRIPINVEQDAPIAHAKPVFRRKVRQAFHIARQTIGKALDLGSNAPPYFRRHFF